MVISNLKLYTTEEVLAAIMAYEKCRNCKYRCTCCSSRNAWECCSGCENHYDEFKPADNIIYCPLYGTKVGSSESPLSDMIELLEEHGFEFAVYHPNGKRYWYRTDDVTTAIDKAGDDNA